MSGIFKPPSDGYLDVPLLAGEQIVRQQAACYLVDGRSIWGGQLVLTNQRLLFRPLDTAAAAKLIQDGVEFLPDNLGVFGKVVSKTLDYSTAYGESKAGAVSTAEITSCRPAMNAALLHPPSLVLTFADGRALEVGVLKTIKHPNFWPANNRARDEVVNAITAQLGQP